MKYSEARKRSQPSSTVSEQEQQPQTKKKKAREKLSSTMSPFEIFSIYLELNWISNAIEWTYHG